MKYIIVLFLFLARIALSAEPVGTCISPCQQFSCYDVLKSDFSCPDNLQAIRGWCPGPSNIQCCMPKGNPLGPIFNEDIKNKIENGEYTSCGSVQESNIQTSSKPQQKAGQNYIGAKCFFPCDNYVCIDSSNPASRCPAGLEPVRGWCPGPRNIQCCLPTGTPTGPIYNKQLKDLVHSGNIDFCGVFKVDANSPEAKTLSETKTEDFKITINGDGSCEYWVKSKELITKQKTSIECGTDALITVGPNNDCRDSGKNTCIVYSNGGSFYGFEKQEGTFNIQFQKPEDVKSQKIYEFVFDNTNPKLLKNPDKLENLLKNIFETTNIKIVIETGDSLGPVLSLNTKFLRGSQNLISSGIPALNLLIFYSKKDSKIYVTHSKECGFQEKEIEDIINKKDIFDKIKTKNYDNAFEILVLDLSQLVKKGKKIDCAVEKEKDCHNECRGFLSSCNKEKCENLGCNWHNKYEICLETEFHESTSTISQRLNSVKSGFRGFVYRDPICHGANCAAYVTRSHEYIFGIGKSFITGVGGSAWQMPRNIKDRGGTVKFYDWQNGKDFTEYDSLMPGDIIGFYYSLSNFRPDISYRDTGESQPKTGANRGNTKDIDFTHVAMYLGKNRNGHIITHLFHPEDCKSCEPVRIESIENFLKKYGNGREFFKIRAVMSPDQQKLYRLGIFNKNEVEFTTHEIKKGDTLASIVNSNEDMMWLVADYNNLVEGRNMDKYIGKFILIPNKLPSSYKYEKSIADKNAPLINALANLIQKRKDENKIELSDGTSEEWARLIIKHTGTRSLEDISLITAIIERESHFQANPISQLLGIENLEGILRPIDVYLTRQRSWSIGCVNVQLCKAEKISKQLNRKDNVYETLQTIDGCILYGAKLIKDLKNNYVTPGEKLTEDQLLSIFIDHNAGEFTSRNQQIQTQLKDLIGEKDNKYYSLKIDGDFLAYDKVSCAQSSTVTESEQAARNFVRYYNIPLTDIEIKNALKLEKTKDFENTKLVKEIRRLWVEEIAGKKIAVPRNSLKSNEIEILPNSGILQVSVSPQIIKRGSNVEIKSFPKFALKDIKYHIITVKIIGPNNEILMQEIKKDCGNAIFCTTFVNILPNIENGILQYWVDIGLSNGESIREPQTGVSYKIISESYPCEGTFSQFQCMDKNINLCLDGSFIPGYCKGPENIQCCVDANTVQTSGEPTAILSLSGNILKGTLTNSQKLCGNVKWTLQSNSGQNLVSRIGDRFNLDIPKPGKYVAVFYCGDETTFDEVYPDFKRNLKSHFEDRIEFYNYYLSGLKAIGEVEIT